MRPLIIDENAYREIERVMTFACERTIDRTTLEKFTEGIEQNTCDVQTDGKPTPLGVDNFCILPFGYKCAFTVEEQPMGWCRHISISVFPPEDGKFPNEVAVAMLLGCFGFHNGIGRGNHLWIENGYAINIIEPLRDDEDPRAIHLAQPWKSRPPTFT